MCFFFFCSSADHLSWIGRLEGSSFFRVPESAGPNENFPKEQSGQDQHGLRSYTDSFNSVEL